MAMAPTRTATITMASAMAVRKRMRSTRFKRQSEAGIGEIRPAEFNVAETDREGSECSHSLALSGERKRAGVSRNKACAIDFAHRENLPDQRVRRYLGTGRPCVRWRTQVL